MVLTFTRKPASLLPLLLGQAIMVLILSLEELAEVQYLLLLAIFLAMFAWASYVTRRKDTKIMLDDAGLIYQDPNKPTASLTCAWQTIDYVVEEAGLIRVEMRDARQAPLLIRLDDWQDADLLVTRIQRYVEHIQHVESMNKQL